MYQWLKYYQVPLLVVGTKIDKVKPSARTKSISQITTLGLTDTPLQLFSAETKFGKDEVWQWIEARMHDQK